MAPFLWISFRAKQTKKKKEKLTRKGWTVRDINLGHSNPTQPNCEFRLEGQKSQTSKTLPRVYFVFVFFNLIFCFKVVSMELRRRFVFTLPLSFSQLVSHFHLSKPSKNYFTPLSFSFFRQNFVPSFSIYLILCFQYKFEHVCMINSSFTFILF